MIMTYELLWCMFISKQISLRKWNTWKYLHILTVNQFCLSCSCKTRFEAKPCFNPKRAGLFCRFQVRGGGGGGGFLAAERRKILKFGTYVELGNTHVLTKLQCWKSRRFWIMQIYVNYMHVFLFLIITDKIRPFRAFKMFWYCRRNI